nr:hydantoinase/oxoprolinase N-terminal domain-containing protein [Rhizobium anhuiense]
MAYRLGVDVGGSFTDFAVLDDRTGKLFTLKVFSRPDPPGEEVLRALDTLKQRDGIDVMTMTIERLRKMTPEQRANLHENARKQLMRLSDPTYLRMQ